MDDLLQPADEPTEADPLISGPISTSTAVRDALTEMFGDAWQEWSDEATGAAAAVLMWLSSNDRLVGGRSAAPTRDDLFVAVDIGLNAAGLGWSDKRQRWVIDSILNALAPVLALGWSAAPTREQDDERPDDSVRRTSLGAQRLVAAIDAHVAKTHEPLAAGKDPAVAAQLFSEDSIELLLKAREVVALLSRSAAEPPDDAAHAVIRRLRTGWEPNIPCLGDEVWCWFHPDHDEPEPVTEAELAVLEATKEHA